MEEIYLLWQILAGASGLITIILGLVILYLIADHEKVGPVGFMITGKLLGIHLLALFFYNYYKGVDGLNKYLWFFRLCIVLTIIFVYLLLRYY